MIKRYKVLRLNYKMMRVIPEENEILRKAGADIIKINGDKILPENLDVDALMVISAKVPGEVINKLSKCRIIARMGIGIDKIDVKVATDNGIIVTNVPDFCSSELAAHNLYVILSAPLPLKNIWA